MATYGMGFTLPAEVRSRMGCWRKQPRPETWNTRCQIMQNPMTYVSICVLRLMRKAGVQLRTC
jgi:hypothetical protein